MSEAAATPVHDEHHDDPWSHVPPPSIWPFLVSLSLILLPFGILTAIGTFDWAHEIANDPSVGGWEAFKATIWSAVDSMSPLLLWGGLTFFFFTIMGWAHQIIKEKPLSHDSDQQQADLKMFTKMFLVSETLAFSAIFAYLYITNYIGGTLIKPEDIHLGGTLVAVATIVLVSSSVTCEFAMIALHRGNKNAARALLFITIAMGVIFLSFQGYEYGLLIMEGFTPKHYDNNPHNAFATLFYTSTGFHGVHVLTGLVMLFLVWVRMEMGHFDEHRHFSAFAASLYWHFVDVVWILLFISVYVMVI